MTSVIPVVAAVIRGREGRILIARRPAHLHQGGKWEFPGGKIESGEQPIAALARELREELGITPVVSRPLIQILHHYPEKSVFLDVWEVVAFSGQPSGKEGQQLEWVLPAELSRYQFPPANLPIIKAAQLPTTWLITPEPADYEPDTFFDLMEASLDAGIGGVIVRTRALDIEDANALIEEAASLAESFEVSIAFNGPLEASLPKGVSRHLTSVQMREYQGGGPVSVSCHSAEELMIAQQIDAEFALLSPVLATTSHPEAQPLGWDRFAAFVKEALLPVYALGGLGNQHVMEARRHGGQGVAGISGFWKDRE